MKLIKEPLQPIPLAAITAEAENRRNELVQSALAITQITTSNENDCARNVAVEIRTHLKDVEATRTQLTKPLLDGQRMLKKLADDHTAPLTMVLERLERLATAFAVTERTRVAAEAKARLDLAAEAKTEADFQAVMAEPIVERAVAQGQQLRRVMEFRVTDLAALYAAKPSCVKLEPRPLMIRELCVPEMPTPGLECWWTDKSSFTTR
jgi:hypothetical protein